MSDAPFDRTIVNVRERPIMNDLNQAQSQMDRTIRDLADRFFAGRISAGDDTSSISNGFVGDGFKIRPAVPASGLGVTLVAGLGFFANPAANIGQALNFVGGLNDLDEYAPLVAPDAVSIAVDAAPPLNAGNPQERWDIVQVKVNRKIGTPTSRDVWDPKFKKFVPGTVDKILSYVLGAADVGKNSVTAAISYKVGVPAALTMAGTPTVDSGYTLIAAIYTATGDTQTAANKIIDHRMVLLPYNYGAIAGSVLVTPGGATAPTVTTLKAPPGVKVCAVLPSGASSADIDVYVFSGLRFACSPTATANDPYSNLATKFLVPHVKDITSGTVNGAIQSAVADVTKAHPVTAVALGQPYLKVTFGCRAIFSSAETISPPSTTTLTGNINSSIGQIPVVSTVGFGSNLLIIDNEIISYADLDATHFGTVGTPATRGAASTAPAAHLAGAVVYPYVPTILGIDDPFKSTAKFTYVGNGNSFVYHFNLALQ